MWKRIVLGIFVAIAVLTSVVLIRTALLKSPPISAPLPTPIALDRDGAIQRLAGSIRIPTISESGKPPDQQAMGRLRDYLEQSFPRVHATMQLEVLPDGALLFTWTGCDPAQDPVILMGHMDVVPAAGETLSEWKHPPFSGEIAEGFVWGRGTLDDKINVVSLLEAAETLIGQGFVPARTILFAFGDDEENGGAYGAQKIVKLLRGRGTQAEFVLDEGGFVISGVVPGIDRPLAVIGTQEKGYVDLALSTTGRGGHSSEAPVHTAIGQLATALTKLEANQFPASIPEVVREQYSALAPHMPFSNRVALANLWLFRPLLIHLGLADPTQAGSYRTSTAITMIHGGFKENALPTSARAIVNLRILPGETISTVMGRVRKVVDDPGVAVENANVADSREPSSSSPLDSNGYRTLATTIHQIFPTAIVTPNLLNAGTDAGFYTAISPNVYRFLAVEADASVLAMLHGVNERVGVDSYLETVQFMAQLIQNIR
jgi:carboxypeptidase PM20D1